jgi:hypothetical protein
MQLNRFLLNCTAHRTNIQTGWYVSTSKKLS